MDGRGKALSVNAICPRCEMGMTKHNKNGICGACQMEVYKKLMSDRVRSFRRKGSI